MAVPHWQPGQATRPRRARLAPVPESATPVWRVPLSLPLPRTVPSWRRGQPPSDGEEPHFVLPKGRVGRGIVSSLRMLLLPLLTTLAVATSLGASPGALLAPPERVETREPFLKPRPVVVMADRLVCSLLGSPKATVGIRGEDGSHTVAVDGLVYWDFGDTLLADGSIIPNGLAWSADHDARDCISLEPKQTAGQAAPLLPSKSGEELTVWPLGMEATAPGQVYFYYASVVPDPERFWRVAGVGLGSFDTETLTARRAMAGALLWPAGMPLPFRTFADQRYVYVFLHAARDPWATDTILARVAKESIEVPSSYEYWAPGRDGQPGGWVSDLWVEEAASWDPALNDIEPIWRQPAGHNGVEVAYNPYLKRWLAVYTSGFMTSVNVRAADRITGPWDSGETVLVDCTAFHPPPQESYVCYTGAQHEVYMRDGGRTIYVSYSNWDSYQVYLHEIRLAAPVRQWTNERGRALYLAGDSQPPEGFRQDGLAFYASDIAVPGVAPIHRWLHIEGGRVRYGATPPYPPDAYQDLGVDFHAPATAADAEATHALHAPVYRWSLGDLERYSPLNLGPAGFARHETAFYAPCPDFDNDGLTDCLESFIGSDAHDADTDGDGPNDGYEHATPGCDPLTYNDDGDGVPTALELLGGTNPCQPVTA